MPLCHLDQDRLAHQIASSGLPFHRREGSWSFQRYILKLDLSPLYTSPAEPKNAVIPAGMEESSAMDGKLSVAQVLDLGNVPTRRFTSL